MSLDWNRNGHIDAADYMITEMLNQELERKKKKQEITKANNERDEDENEFLEWGVLLNRLLSGNRKIW